MISKIHINTCKKVSFSESTKNSNSGNSQQDSSINKKNNVGNNIKNNNFVPSMNKLQIISLTLGGLASAALLVYFSRDLIPFSKNRKILKDIKKANLPDNVRKKLLIEYEKLRKTNIDTDGTKNYIKNVLRVNWTKPSQNLIEIDKAREVLDNDHVGLNSVKDELISFFKMQNYNLKNNIQVKEPLILCLDGPPGVGKTSIAESIAKAMDKKFERISLAGVSNKSFIKGAERLFKNAEPGQIMKSIQNAGTSDPVILLDEIDKMGRSVEHGNPAFALLDALEPKQCKNFTDENIELPFDLSNVTFIITSNDLRNIPEVLKDRLSVIHIPPYKINEKENICRFTIDKMMKNLKILDSQVEFSDVAVNRIVTHSNDEGARKTIENVKCIFNKIIQELETKGNTQKIVINKNFIDETLRNRQTTKTQTSKSDSEKSLDNLFRKIFNMINSNS